MPEPAGAPELPGPDLAFGENPLLSDEPGTWDRLIDAAGPVALLVSIRARMGARAREQMSAEDVWQETLLQLWRDRERLRWQGLRAFRRLLLEIAHHRIQDELELRGAQKRGGGRTPVSLSGPGSRDSAGSAGFGCAGPLASTTPSFVASLEERAELMQRALETLALEEREILLLRLFEDVPLAEAAARAGISVSTAKRRYRRGAAEYSRQLAALVGSHGSGAL